jgi:hypothetical protein
MESDCSIVFQQAANRLPVEKAILISSMGADEPAVRKEVVECTEVVETVDPQLKQTGEPL